MSRPILTLSNKNNSRTARDISERVDVMELYKRATMAEPWSKMLWLAYCEWVWSLHTDCQNGDAGWSEEEQMLGQELFKLETALGIWQDGYQAIRYRINDSHELWNRWISIELEQASKDPNPAQLGRIQALFVDRLQIPHSTWDATFNMYSSFVTKYENTTYMEKMPAAKANGAVARELYELREPNELRLQQAISSGNDEVVSSVMKDYLSWELALAGKKGKREITSSPLILSAALFERALSSTILYLDPVTWVDYVDFLSGPPRITDASHPIHLASIPAVLPVIQRAARHCPSSGKLWSRYILRAEYENQPFQVMEQIKHAATSTGQLDRDGMEGVVEFYSAWCGYLKRRTMVAGATDEEFDVAEVGLRSALEDIQQWRKLAPSFRVERIFVSYLTQKHSIEEARAVWKSMVKSHGNSYEFWQQYYFWEMTVRAPTASPELATNVLFQAIKWQGLDWPEEMMKVYIRHCENYEDVGTLLKALSTVHYVAKGVAKRREREAAVYAQQQTETYVQPAVEAEVETPTGTSKRKREAESEEQDSASKKIKSVDQDASQELHLKRNRENTTVLVTGLPPAVTQTKIKQYFREYGHINNIISKAEPDGLTTVALIEFRTPDDAQSALLRDGKYFTDKSDSQIRKQITVKPGTGLTLYVTNFPPETLGDDSYIQDLFKNCGDIISIRWPSLKYNVHRRFCYVSFRTPEAAAAATKLHGQTIESKGAIYKLTAEYSRPAEKKDREGAMAEGREIHITSLDKSLKEDDVKKVFSAYGNIEKVRILKNMAGESKGSCFVSFESKEQATAALVMDKTKFKSRVLTVELSTGKNFKPTATIMGKASSASPGPDVDGDSVMSQSPAPESHLNTHAQHTPSQTENTNKIITLMNIPDTVNDARIRAIAEKHGEIVKLTLRPDHGGAIIEYKDVAAAGRASLALENHEIVPGRRLRTGGLKDLFVEKAEIRTDRTQATQGKKTPTAFIQPSAPVRRPGGRGGLGQKKGLGYTAPKAVTGSAGSSADTGLNGHSEETQKPKSNADFKAMFLSGGMQ